MSTAWFEALPLGQIFNGSGWAVAFWAILYATRMVFRGDLVTRRTYEGAMQALDIERKRSELLLERIGDLTDSMETFEAFVRALPQPVQTPTLPAIRGQRRRDRNGHEDGGHRSEDGA